MNSNSVRAGLRPTTIRISPVTAEEELDRVGRFRYSVTVEEMKLKMRHADHSRRTVIEPMDRDGHVLAAWEGENVIGTVRTNLLSRSNIGAYYDDYAIDDFPSELKKTLSISTRMAIAPQFRRSGLFTSLSVAMYQYWLEQGVTLDVIDCRFRLFPMIAALGYVVHRPKWAHPEFGDVTVLYLETRNETQLRAVNSPFLAALQETQLNTRALLVPAGAIE